MFDESRNGGRDAMPPSFAEIVAGWALPENAYLADTIRRDVLALIASGYDDPEAIAAVALGPLVMALGRLEVDLADARTRIAELEQAAQPRNNRH
ncbi:hypothetical protein [Nocardia neocaledoniensis]|uniref:hypothetical protein n=1 Tax=Nocardia neocaledoniensis TaxID=236511 RepID=UPI002457C360|nr:hypothetical protein [Nocardia neocaledoniensis]